MSEQSTGAVVTDADPAANPYAEVLQGTSEDILRFILEGQVQSKLLQSFGNRYSAINRSMRRYWENSDSYWKGLFLHDYNLSNPHFVDSLEKENFEDQQSFRDATYTELEGRAKQRRYYKEFGNLLAATEDVEQIQKLIPVFGFLHVETKPGFDGTISPGTFAGRIVNKVAHFHEDKDTGLASPDEIADAALPLIEALLQQVYAVNPGVDPYKINTQVSKRLLTNIAGRTADYMAALTIRERLDAAGYPGFESTKARKRNAHHTSPLYLTQSAWKVLSGLDHPSSVPESAIAMETIHVAILRQLQRLAQDYPAAAQVLKAYSREEVEPHYGSSAKITPFLATIRIANIVTPILNEREELAGDASLQLLDTQDLSQLPVAFQRILYAIDPSLLEDAFNGSLYRGNTLRRTMALVEGLCINWLDDKRKQYGLTIGDFVLQMLGRGFNDEEISEALTEIGSARPDDKATRAFRRVIADPRTKNNHVIYNRRKAGHGVIS